VNTTLSWGDESCNISLSNLSLSNLSLSNLSLQSLSVGATL
jgi:hypothetical protein